MYIYMNYINNVNVYIIFLIQTIYHVRRLYVLYFITLKRDKRIRNALIMLLKAPRNAILLLSYLAYEVID